MSKTVDDLLSRHYMAHVLRRGDVNEALGYFKAAVEDPDIKSELEARHRAIKDIGLCDADLAQRDFCAYIELLALRKILTMEGNTP